MSTWRPPSIEPHNGPVSSAEIAPWLNLFELLGIVDRIIDGAHVDLREHVLNWLAFSIQHQKEKIYHGLLFYGVQGAGKDSLLMPMHEILGSNYVSTEIGEVSSGFNDYLSRAKVLQINELCPSGNYADNRTFVNSIKTILAPSGGTGITVNPKYGQKFKIQNRVNVIAHTNHYNGLQLEPGERRWCCIDCGVTPQQVLSERYQAELMSYHAWASQPANVAKIFRYLMDRDLSAFDPTLRPPRTEYQVSLEQDSRTRKRSATEKSLADKLSTRTVVTFEEARNLVADNPMEAGGSIAGSLLAEALLSVGFSKRETVRGVFWVRVESKSATLAPDGIEAKWRVESGHGF